MEGADIRKCDPNAEHSSVSFGSLGDQIGAGQDIPLSVHKAVKAN